MAESANWLIAARWAAGLLVVAGIGLLLALPLEPRAEQPAEREEIVFWHFWGGADRLVVEDVVARFNVSQAEYFVRAVAMPGNNLDLKVFLSVTGGDPPDVINQDDPIVADWAWRGALTAIDELASPAELAELDSFLLPPARRLGAFDNRLYAVCNGLDIRALYYNATLLDQLELQPPRTLAELDHIAHRATVRDAAGRYERFGYLPDARRLWAWGIVFGGQFHHDTTQSLTVASPRVVAALEWMQAYRERYGADAISAYRQGDQSLPGKPFPLLANRYAVVMDGQWRVRDVAAFQRQQREAGQPVTQFGVCPLPPPPAGRSDAGWVNGNFFVVPKNCRNPRGAWAFMKFWVGLGEAADEAARTCAAGGWIPVSDKVIARPAYQAFLDEQPLMRQFVTLARSPAQIPTPVIPGAPLLYREVNTAAAEVMYVPHARPAKELLSDVQRRVAAHVARLRERRRVP